MANVEYWRVFRNSPWGELEIMGSQLGLVKIGFRSEPDFSGNWDEKNILPDWWSNFDESFSRYLWWGSQIRELPPLDHTFNPREWGAKKRHIYEVLMKTWPGDVLTYGQLALLAGLPRAARFVGSCMAQNPLPLLIPCHRVISSNGDLGAYSFGTGPILKAEILRWEKSLRKVDQPNLDPLRIQ